MNFNSTSWHDSQIIAEEASHANHNYPISIGEVVGISKNKFYHKLQPKLHTHFQVLFLRFLEKNKGNFTVLIALNAKGILNLMRITINNYRNLLAFALLRQQYWEITLLRHFSCLLVFLLHYQSQTGKSGVPEYPKCCLSLDSHPYMLRIYNNRRVCLPADIYYWLN